MMVCKIAELSAYDKVVQIAALLHDIGKPASRKINPRNKHVQFFGHETLSAKMAIAVLEKMQSEKIINVEENREILKLIEHHAFMHKNEDLLVFIEYFKGDIAFCIHLIELSRCDNLGRFCVDISSDKKYDKWLEKINKILILDK
jgi:putative nucleotidyltransferase with HDIG domain